jgi:hypothetical protein
MFEAVLIGVDFFECPENKIEMRMKAPLRQNPYLRPLV